MGDAERLARNYSAQARISCTAGTLLHLRSCSILAPRAAAELTILDRQCGEIFRQHPSPSTPDLVAAVPRLLASADLGRATLPL